MRMYAKTQNVYAITVLIIWETVTYTLRKSNKSRTFFSVTKFGLVRNKSGVLLSNLNLVISSSKF